MTLKEKSGSAVKLAGQFLITVFSQLKLLSFGQIHAPEHESEVGLKKFAAVTEKIDFEGRSGLHVN